MRTTFEKTTVAIISIISLSALIVFSADIGKKGAQQQNAAISQTQPGSEILAGSYSTMMNTLIATGR